MYNKLIHMLEFLITKMHLLDYLVCWTHEWTKQMSLSVWKVLESTRV